MSTALNKKTPIEKKIIFFTTLILMQCSGLMANQFTQTLSSHQDKKSCLYCGDVRNNYSQNNTGNRTTQKNNCPFCSQLEENNDEHYVIVKRFEKAFLKLNDAPYTEGTALLLPPSHIKNFESMNKKDRISFLQSLFASVQAVKEVTNCKEIHMGLNMGREAGASQPSHMHWHIVPIQDKDQITSLPSNRNKKNNTEVYQSLRDYFNNTEKSESEKKAQPCNINHDCNICPKSLYKVEQNKEYVIAETKHAVIKLSTKPAHNGHVLYIPKRDRVSLSSEATQEELEDISTFFTRMPHVYQELFGTQEETSLNFHISEMVMKNSNEQEAAYISAIPRRIGDTAFLPVLAHYPLITRDMDILHKNFKKRWEELDEYEWHERSLMSKLYILLFGE